MESLANQQVYITTGSVDRPLAQRIAYQLGLTLNDDEIKIFPSGERYFRYVESVRGKHVLIIQSLVQSSTGSVNDALLELILMIDAARRASASEITVVSPYLAYMRQDRKARGREPISAAAVINLLQATGAHRLVSVDMHSAQTQAVFDGPFDHLTAEKIIYKALKERINGNTRDFVVVSPDGGRAKTAEMYAQLLEIDVEHIPKKRDRTNSAAIYRPDTVDGVEGKNCILIDDMIDTAGTLVSAAATLQASGAKSVIAVATHGLLSDPAIERIKESAITELFITDTLPTEEVKNQLGDTLRIIPSAEMIASSLTAIVSGGSLLQIFEDRNYY
jgi:ribose-phosphate pyrophosphokinase